MCFIFIFKVQATSGAWEKRAAMQQGADPDPSMRLPHQKLTERPSKSDLAPPRGYDDQAAKESGTYVVDEAPSKADRNAQYAAMLGSVTAAIQSQQVRLELFWISPQA